MYVCIFSNSKIIWCQKTGGDTKKNCHWETFANTDHKFWTIYISSMTIKNKKHPVFMYLSLLDFLKKVMKVEDKNMTELFNLKTCSTIYFVFR